MRSWLRGGAPVFVGVAVVAAMFAAPAAGGAANRALDRVLAEGAFAADELNQLQRGFAAARQAGVEERAALSLVESCVEGEFGASHALRMLSIAAQLALEKLPVDNFITKVEEGVSKRVPADRVVQVAERRALMLNKAKLIINSLVLQGFAINDRDDLLPDLAAALEAGRSPEDARTILSNALRDGERSGAIRRKLFP